MTKHSRTSRSGRTKWRRGVRRLDALRNTVWGVRSSKELVVRGLEFLTKAFSPQRCLAVTMRDDQIKVLASVDSLGRASFHPHGNNDNKTAQWFDVGINEIKRVWDEKLTSILDGPDTRDVLFPLLGHEGIQAVILMVGCPKGVLGPRDREDIERISRELGERISLMKAIEALTSTLDGDSSKASETRVKMLESLLIQITKEATQRQEELERLKEQWAYTKNFTDSVLQSMSSGLITVDSLGRIKYMNRGAERILQYSAEEALGKPLSFVMTSKEKRHPLQQGSDEEDSSFGRQMRIMRKDGTEIPIGFTVSPHTDLSGTEIGKIIHFRDLSEINEMQEELLRMDRLVFLGEISMGIAHEIRNPLAGIRITAQALEEEVRENELLREYVSRIISEIDRLNDLLRAFFSFAKPQKPRLISCHLPMLIEEVLFLVKKDLEKRRIQVVQDHSPSVPNVLMDANQMKQVFLNLILNSMQAIGSKGNISISSNVSPSRGKPRDVVVAFHDSGKGILPQHQSKVFDPFFTTKAKGLGLGLSITYRIVKRHGGRIRVKSEVGKGTTFYIHLPVDGPPGAGLGDAI